MAGDSETKRYKSHPDEPRRRSGPREESRRRWGGRGQKSRNRNRWNSSAERPKCPLCKQNIRDILTAIAVTEAKLPAHFDCVLKNISQSEVCEHRERIVYLGKGEFGIIKFKGGNSNKFVIRKRIAYEQAEDDIPWRKEISRHLKR